MAHVDATTLSLLALGEDIDADYGHVLDCPRCHSELTSLRRTVALAEQGDLTDEDILGLPAYEPPSHVWSRIQDEMLAPCGDPQRRRIVCPNWSVAASVALGLVLGGGIVHMAAAGPDAPASGQYAQMSRVIATAALTPAGKKGAAQASAEVISDGRSARVVVHAQGMPRRPGDRYRVELREPDGARIELGDITAPEMTFDVPAGAELPKGLDVEILSAPAGSPDSAAKPVLSGAVTPAPQGPGLSAGPEAVSAATLESLTARSLPGAGPAVSAFSAGSAAATQLSRSGVPAPGTTPAGPVTEPTGVPTTTSDAGEALLPGSPGSAPVSAAEPGSSTASPTVPGSPVGPSPAPQVRPGQSGAGAPGSGSVPTEGPVPSPGSSSTAGSSPAVPGSGSAGSSAASSATAGSSITSGPSSLLAPPGGPVSATGTTATATTTGASSSPASTETSPGKSSSTSPTTKRKKRKKRVKSVPLAGAPSASRRPASTPEARKVPTPSPAATPSPSSLASRVQSEPPIP